MMINISNLTERIRDSLYDGFWKLAPWIFFVIGIFLLGISYLHLTEAEHSEWHNFFVGVGSLLISAGIFSVTLKSIQYMKLYRDELTSLFKDPEFERIVRKVVYADPTDEPSLRRLAEPLVRACTTSRNPLLEDGAISELSRLIGVCVADGHYRHFKRTIRLKKYDSTNRLLELDDELFVELIPAPSVMKLVYESEITSKASKFTKGTLRVNGVDWDSAINISDHAVGYKLDLEGSSSYQIDRKYHKTIDLRHDPYVLLRLVRPTLNLGLNIENHVSKDISVIVKPSGFHAEADPKWSLKSKDEKDAAGNVFELIELRKTSLTPPYQGYVVVFGS